MFSDVERSPSWHSPALTPLATTELPSSQSQYQTSSRPPVQSGWFPLQDTSSADPTRAADVYSDTMLPPRQPMPHSQWPAQEPSTPYMGLPDNRPQHTHAPRPYPPEPSPYSPMYSQGYGTPVQDVGPPGGFGWQDARPMAPPPIHTTGLEHLRMPGPYDDMSRVHAAAQGMHAMMGMGPRYPGMGYGSPPRKKNHKEISIGRWTAEEHRVFLKGLEMYQGPSWGEIARMIGTRTSTQVRTHAQKFFTKLARTNQMLPYFENQIQKERTRLITQGAVIPSQSSVTPTSTTPHNYAFTTLSPPRKREYPGAQRMPGYDDHLHTLRPPMSTMSTSTPSPYMDQSSSMDMYKPRMDPNQPELMGIRKPRIDYTALGGDQQPVTPYGDQTPHQMMSYTPTESYRDPGQYAGDWNDAASRPWPPSVDLSSDPAHATSDPELPSVTRLLYRNPPSA